MALLLLPPGPLHAPPRPLLRPLLAAWLDVAVIGLAVLAGPGAVATGATAAIVGPGLGPAPAPVVLGGLQRTRSFGGLSAEAAADAEVQALFTDEIKAKMGADTETEVVVLKYSSQVVAGKNFFVKAELLKNKVMLDIMHVRIFVPLGDGQPELVGALRGKTMDEEIAHFDGFNY